MSWHEILQNFVIISLFIFELYVIEIFLPNSVLMRYFRRWPSSCHVSSGRHIGWIRPNWILPNSVWCDISVSGHPLAEYDQIKNHVLMWNPAKFRYHKSLHIWAIRDWDIPSKLRFDVIYPSVAILTSRQFRAACWLITTKTLVAGGTLLTQRFSFLKDREIMYHSLYMWKILLWANALRTPYWLSWCHVSPGWHISWSRTNWYTCPEVKSCKVWLS